MALVLALSLGGNWLPAPNPMEKDESRTELTGNSVQRLFFKNDSKQAIRIKQRSVYSASRLAAYHMFLINLQAKCQWTFQCRSDNEGFVVGCLQNYLN